MAVAGIIAEYNPFHRGHAWQIAALRERLGPDTAVVAVMSGNFVQRGDFALLRKHARAEMALSGGADLVLELPAPWSSAAAERFAQGGVALLAATGVATHLVFGSECGDLGRLQAAAACLDGEAYQAGLRRFLDEGMTFAAARQEVVRALAGDAAECLDKPNNNLAVEYLRALAACGASIEPVALPRTGAGHDSGELGEYPSASAIRACVLAGQDWKTLVPEPTAAVLEREMGAGRAPVSIRNCERAVLARLRTMEEEDFRPYDGGGEGLYHRFYDAVHTAPTLEELLFAAKTKRYPLSRLRRMMLHSYLGVRQATRGQTPPYLRVLGANERGRRLLRQMTEKAALPLLTKPADVRKLGVEAQELFTLEARCTDLYALAYPRLFPPGSEYTESPVML